MVVIRIRFYWLIPIASVVFEKDLLFSLYYIAFDDFESYPVYDMTTIRSVTNLIIDGLVLTLVILSVNPNSRKRNDPSFPR